MRQCYRHENVQMGVDNSRESSMKIITVIGARPQFIKAAVISRAINQVQKSVIGAGLIEIIIHTGQHYDKNMSQIFFEQMSIPKPDYNLEINDCSHGLMTGKMLEKIESILNKEKPDLVLLYGDTNSTLSGALAAAKLNIPIAHVEAGLRSFNMSMPEEINRVLTDRLSHWLFCPTQAAIDNLKKEGILEAITYKKEIPKVINVGDVMYDAVMHYRNIAKPTDKIGGLIEKHKHKYYLATVHRAENTDDPERLIGIIQALEKISLDMPVILPLHPRTRMRIEKYIGNINNLTCIEPVGYFDMIKLLDNTNMVITDSGGMQKEAYFMQKPCVTLRDETEWVELINGGYNKLAGTNTENIIATVKSQSEKNMKWESALYGDGTAGQKIISSLLSK